MSLGPLELALILGIALLLFGPSRLPGLGKSLGDAIRGFKKGLDEEPQEAKRISESSPDPLVDKNKTAEKSTERS